MEFFIEAKHLLKQNIREYGMYIALVVIMIIFTITTNGLFISSRNISNLINQTGYIAVLAVGMTLVIVIKHIDLSVGFASGFMGAIAAILLTRFNAPFIVTIIIVLVVGMLIGLFNGFLIATMGIPSFVATLAGMLIFRGGILLLTESSGTIVISNDAYNAIGNGFIPDIAHIQGIHLLTILIGIVAIILYALSILNTRKNKIKYNFEVVSKEIFIFQLIFVSAIIAYITWILAGYNGLSWTVVIVIAVVAIYHYVTMQTVLGRHIYAVGGNIEAAKLSGIDVKKITYIVFASMGMLIGLCGILFSARLQSASTTAGTLFELDAIAAAYVGGVSADGGIGKVTGSIVGALVMSSLISGMNLMGTGISYQYIIRGAVLVIAVIFDVKTRNKSK
jgi:putative multiple sugar transport system permease protein